MFIVVQYFFSLDPMLSVHSVFSNDTIIELECCECYTSYSIFSMRFRCVEFGIIIIHYYYYYYLLFFLKSHLRTFLFMKYSTHSLTECNFDKYLFDLQRQHFLMLTYYFASICMLDRFDLITKNGNQNVSKPYDSFDDKLENDLFMQTGNLFLGIIIENVEVFTNKNYLHQLACECKIHANELLFRNHYMKNHFEGLFFPLSSLQIQTICSM